jgi:hypothetical protein
MFNKNEFLDFLVEAKKATYASQGDDASVTPLLTGSRQLEFQSGDFLYRDIYFGMAYFIGQETVYSQDNPIWSMAYSGGTINLNEIELVREIYSFLREAMRNVSFENPFRGPKEFIVGELSYKNESTGDFDSFSGEEFITFKGVVVYRLNYSGGLIK